MVAMLVENKFNWELSSVSQVNITLALLIFTSFSKLSSWSLEWVSFKTSTLRGNAQLTNDKVYLSCLRLCSRLNIFFAPLTVFVYRTLFHNIFILEIMVSLHQEIRIHLTLFRMSPPPSPTSLSSVTSTNVGISPQNVLTFSYNPFATLV